jgi:hypothetical protein
MSGIISGNMVGGAAPLRTLILEDTDGNQLTGVVVGREVIFTANAAEDIREGKVAATDAGVVTGSAIIPNYETSTGQKIIRSGRSFTLSLSQHDAYNYTELQCIICAFNTSMDDSVAAEKVVIGDNVYSSNSTIVVSNVTKNLENKSIDFNLINTSDISCIIRYFTYKELY